MSSFPILNLVVGMIFIYFLLGIICSSAVELWFAIRKTRARLLEKWLKRIFDTNALNSHGQPLKISVGQAIMDHCMVTVLSEKGKSTAYINAENFVSALLDKITLAPAVAAIPGVPPVQMPPRDLATCITAIENSTLISGELKRTILAFAYQAKEAASVINTIPSSVHVVNNITATIKSDFDGFRERLEGWYNTNADRLAGTMKRSKAMPATFIISVLITVSLNADSISISKYLYDHKEVGKTFADKALFSLDSYRERIEGINKTADPGTIGKLDSSLRQMQNDIDSMKKAIPASLPMGWDAGHYKEENFFKKAGSMLMDHGLGWLATILAISAGAPFWFDLLNKIANLRGSGPRPPAKGSDTNTQ